MSCELCSNATEWNSTNNMCGIERAALSGLVGFGVSFTQGVALGWFVFAPSGRNGAAVRRALRSVIVLVILFFVSVPRLLATQSPLADAAEKSDRATIRTLLKQHADVNAAQADGMTALHWAADLDDLETAKVLAAAKANANATNRYG